MLMGRDFDVNFLQTYPDDSFKDFLKQTMISQDVMFRKQVNELHRLYMTQKSLMNDIGCQEFSQYASGRVVPQSTFVPGANQMRRDLLAIEKTYMPVVNSHFQQGGFTGSRFQQRPFDLQAPTGDYVNYFGGEVSQKGYEVKDHFLHDNACRPGEVNLSLSIGGTSRSKNTGNKSWNDDVICLQDVIDLEKSEETTSTEEPKSVSLDMEGSTETENGFKLFPSNEMIHLDLNKDQLDESCLYSIDPQGGNPSLDKSTGVFGFLGRVHGCADSNHTTLGEPNNINTSEDISANASCSIDLGSTSGPPLDLTDSPVSNGTNCKSSQLAKTPCRDDNMGSSEESETQHSCSDQKKREFVEVDYTTQKAALSLLSISLDETSSNNRDCSIKSGSNQIEDEETADKVKPQCSSDSYESLVLKLKESNVDDDCVSSKPFEVDEMDKKESGVKLRRGRRLKDFQKDILPSLATLSRHEIWEDIHIIEGVIRSREYKKLRAEAAKTENWFTPVRSKRSRLNYVGRKCYS